MPTPKKPNIGRNTRRHNRVSIQPVQNDEPTYEQLNSSPAKTRRRDNDMEHDAGNRSAQQPTTPSKTSRARLPLLAGTIYRAQFPSAFQTICDIGSMIVICTHCGAKLFKGESPSLCCSNGKVKMEEPDTPPLLQQLFDNRSPQSKRFLQNVRLYNAAFQMTSFKANKISENFMPTFKVHGQLYHLAGSLQAKDGDEPKFLQIYFVTNRTEQTDLRIRNFPEQNLDTQLVSQLQNLLHDCNGYITKFKAALENMNTPDCSVVIREDKTPDGEHSRRYNAPTTDDIGVIIAGDETAKRDIVLKLRDDKLQRVNETHRSYDALQYPLLLPYGEDGYNFYFKHYDPKKQEFTTKKVSAMQFYAHRLMVRHTYSSLPRARDLAAQFWVDMYAKIETERLNFLRYNQKQLRSEEYVTLKDALITDGNVDNMGQKVILPSTFTGGPRYMHERAQDAMSYVRLFGRPDLFITFTCNPKWKEIQTNLLPGQTSKDRHDLSARVFHLKHKRLMELLVKSEIFGSVLCHLYTIEWQKRGLPHAHILLWFKDKLRPEDIDKIVSAEFPNKDEDPILYEIITKQMVHGPCGQLNLGCVCMNKETKSCTKKYPKTFVKDTQTSSNGYPLYRRRSPDNGGESAIVKCRGNDIEIDNRWVVPHSKFLCREFDAHINVEVCTSIESIKYVCKYVCKGADMAVFQIQQAGVPIDEITLYHNGRYISTDEAIWRILGFSIHERFPPVQHLVVHLENGQRVYFTDETVRHVAQRPPPKTTLTAFFQLCEEDDFARTLLYHELPQYYTWNTAKKEWKKRIRGKKQDTDHVQAATIGRVYTVHPNNAECFYLRLLLHKVVGPTGYASLKTVGGETLKSFRNVCLALGLLEDDKHWENTLTDAALTTSPSQIRQLFTIMLHFCELSDPVNLWEKFRNHMTEDILNRYNNENPLLDLTYTSDMYNEALSLIQDLLKALPSGKNVHDYGLPIVKDCSNTSIPREIISETSYDQTELLTIVSTRVNALTDEQAQAYHHVCTILDCNEGGIVFLDAPAGTGKTFVLNLLLARVRVSKHIALAVASSGIAATLLKGGRTAHSTFKLPISLTRTEQPMCNITKRSGTAALLRKATFIVWDECTMAHKCAYEALDRTLRDIRDINSLMGGVLLLIAGDFRQTLPVIQRGSRANQVSACLKASYLWRHVQTLKLKTNMRVHMTGDETSRRFSNELMSIGDGTIGNMEGGLITFPDNFADIVKDMEELIDRTFPNFTDNYTSLQWLSERAILSPTNARVREINELLLNRISSSEKTYVSLDTTADVADAVNFPTEFLNSLHPSGLPPHQLRLKIGVPIMLLRNLNPPKLCNGTRLIVSKLHANIIEATIATGEYVGEIILIPRIPLIPSDTTIPFRRLQFPIQLSFAVTINKSQGQTLQEAGLDLRDNCFSHGQLYVACSRVRHPNRLHILAQGNLTKNIVYPEVFQ